MGRRQGKPLRPGAKVGGWVVVDHYGPFPGPGTLYHIRCARCGHGLAGRRKHDIKQTRCVRCRPGRPPKPPPRPAPSPGDRVGGWQVYPAEGRPGSANARCLRCGAWRTLGLSRVRSARCKTCQRHERALFEAWAAPLRGVLEESEILRLWDEEKAEGVYDDDYV